MSRSDKSVEFLTGMIIAGLYVVLLVGFSRESYVIRDGDLGIAKAAAASAAKPVCAADGLTCATLSPGAPERTCLVSLQLLRQLIDAQLKPPILEPEGAEAGSDSE